MLQRCYSNEWRRLAAGRFHKEVFSPHVQPGALEVGVVLTLEGEEMVDRKQQAWIRVSVGVGGTLRQGWVPLSAVTDELPLSSCTQAGPSAESARGEESA